MGQISFMQKCLGASLLISKKLIENENNVKLLNSFVNKPVAMSIEPMANKADNEMHFKWHPIRTDENFSKPCCLVTQILK